MARALAALCVVLLALAAAGAATASAAPLTWSRAAGMTPPADADPGNPDATLSAVACPAAGACTAAGSYTDAANAGRALVATQVDGTWSAATALLLPTDAHAGHPDADASALACGAVGTCALAGTYVATSGHTEAMVTRQSSGTWSRATHLDLPANAGATSAAPAIAALACGAPDACSAVGSYAGTGGRRALVATQSGGVWGAASELGLPADADASAPDAALHAVSCGASGSCAAVGSYKDHNGAYRAMVAVQTGGTWSAATALALPAGASAGDPDAYLDAVACWAPGACTALGSYSDGSGGVRAMSTDLSGAGAWSVAATLALPADARVGDPDAYVAAVACGGASACGATGTYVDASGTRRAMVIARQGATWSPATRLVLPGDADPTADAWLGSVSCGGVGDCAGAGSYLDARGALRPMTASQTGASWSPASAVALADDADSATPDALVTSLACATGSSCALVGHYTGTSGRRAMAASSQLRQDPPPPGGTTTVPAGPTAVPPTGHVAIPSTHPLTTLTTTRLVAVKGVIKLKLTCKHATCTGVVKITTRAKRRAVILATASYTIAAGKSKTVTLRLTKPGRTAFRHSSRHPVKIALVLAPRNAASVTKSATVH
jgi:hypothetical protein